MTWLAFLKALIVAAAEFASWMRNRELMDAGRAESIAQHLSGVLDEIAQAQLARTAVRREFERDPDRLRDDDGFRRKD